MSRSINSGISGMSVNQEAMDVISNNIANQGTTAFKSSSVTFQDMLYQTSKDANGPSLNAGGTNPLQVGLGVQVGAININETQGNMSTTGRNLDTAIDGDGYFIVEKGPQVFNDNGITVNQAAGTHNVNTDTLSSSGATLMYTRDGSFTLDSQGNLLTADGYRVMGYPLTNDTDTTKAPTAVAPTLATNSFDGGVLSFTAGQQLNGYTLNIANVSGATTATTVDTTAKTITVTGDFTNGLSYSSVAKSINSALVASKIAQTVTIAPPAGSPTSTSFSPNTTYTTAAAPSLSTTINGGTSVESIASDGTVDYVNGSLNLSAYDTNLKSLRIPESVHNASTGQNLKVTGFSIAKDGVITATLEDGTVSAIGQIAMASFSNPAGLASQGQNIYEASVNSGDAVIKSGVGTLGEDNSKGYGDIDQGMLETSNVDLAKEFTNMIVTSRAFQANGKVITTSDQMIQSVLNIVQ
jgi:flagellar hook protein FlgE